MTGRRDAPCVAGSQPWLLDVALAAVVTFVCILGTIHMEAEIGTDRPIDGLAVGAAAVAGVALVARRRSPAAVLAVVLGAVAIYTGRAYPGGPVYLAGAIALFTVAAAVPRRTGYGLAALIAAGLFVVSVVARREVAVNDVLFVLWPAVAVLAADAMRGRRERAAVEAERAAHAEEQREQDLRRRLAEDRLRIARDLHDSVAHSMATINVQSGVAAHVLDRNPAQAGVALEAIRVASRDVLTELSAVLDVLRDDDAAAPRHPTPDLTLLGGLVESSRLAGVTVDLDVRGEIDAVPPAISTAAYRIIQEGLTNVSRHAGTDHAAVVVAVDAARVAVEVVDAGRGAAVAAGPGGGRGLVGIRERATITGGRSEIGPAPGGGFRVHVTWDLRP